VRRTTAAVLAAGALLFGAPGARGQDHDDAQHGAHGGHSGHGGEETEIAPAPLPPGSIYQLESPWTTSEGREIRLGELGGRIQVLAMVYTHCEHACPLIVGDMRRIRREIGDTEGRVGFVLASLDPARDDVARLAAFAEKTGLASGWQLLRAPESSVRELAAALGIRYRRVSAEDFLHSNLISVLDPDGVVVHRQVGLGVDPDATVSAIRTMLDEGSQPAPRPPPGEMGEGAPERDER